ncbi:MAG: glycoside hydrolase family 32 protein [Bacteroidota bacterium]
MEEHQAWHEEPYRPQYHFTPKQNWMNDPNGLVFYKGWYHLFYQYYPDDTVWGPMHWGHARSMDMMHWEHLPIALYPDELGLIFSGSAVIDSQNTSGFGSTQNPAMVAMYTYHLMEGEKAGRDDFQTQGIAYSLDEGATWTKYEGNPVIPNDGIKDFRDPKVFWHEPTKMWVMALVAGDHVKFYDSPNLKEWTHISDFGKEVGAHGGVWECPDLFPLTDAKSGERKWALLVSINPGAPNGGSGTQYFIGEFDGKEFVSAQTEAKWLDYGTDDYAGVTYNNLPEEERIFIGWMSNWDYARDTPTESWRSAMTLPRKLFLEKDGEDYWLKNLPLASVESLVAERDATSQSIQPKDSLTLSGKDFNQSLVRFQTASQNFRLVFSNAEKNFLILEMDAARGQVMLDRRASGKIGFHPEFGNKEHIMPVQLPKGQVYDVSLYLDKSSIEVFIDGGKYTMTQQIFPDVEYDQLEIHNLDGVSLISDFGVYPISSVWIDAKEKRPVEN